MHGNGIPVRETRSAPGSAPAYLRRAASSSAKPAAGRARQGKARGTTGPLQAPTSFPTPNSCVRERHEAGLARAENSRRLPRRPHHGPRDGRCGCGRWRRASALREAARGPAGAAFLRAAASTARLRGSRPDPGDRQCSATPGCRRAGARHCHVPPFELLRVLV